jgi:predicted nucleic acid-binding Zn ribbon protein
MAEYICPSCGKPIYDDDALLCLYCGGSLRKSVGFMGKVKYLPIRIILVLIVMLVLIAFLLLILH